MKPPLLLRGGLTGRVYIVTRYKVLDAEKGLIESITKYDVTDQFDALAAEAIARVLELRPQDLDTAAENTVSLEIE